MNKTLFKLLVGCILLATTFFTIADDHTDNLAASCSACHGNKGMSNNDEWPNLAGQQKDYLISQIKAFRDGKRKNAMMAPMVQSLTDDQIASLAKYYSGLPNDRTVAKSVNQAGKNVRARCVSCHGMRGITVTSSWPNIAGQKASYIKKQLMDFKSGERYSPIMEVIAKELTDQQIADVAEYYSQI